MGQTITALDVGFGYTKAISRATTAFNNGEPRHQERDFKQPSIVGEYCQVYEENLTDDDIVFIEKNPQGEVLKESFIGYLASRHSKVKYATKKTDKADTWTTKVLIKTAMAKVAPNTPTKVVSSLPMDFYFNQKERFQEMLLSLNYEPEYDIRVGRKEAFTNKIYIEKVKLVPQGYAAGMDYLLDDRGKIMEDRKADAAKENLVIDPGFNTLGLLVIDAMEISTRSHSPENMGVTKAYELMQEYLKNKVGHAPQLYDLDRYVLKGEFDALDLTPLTDRALQAYAGLIQMEIDNFNTRFNKYIVTGGWASQIAKYLNVPRDRLIISDQMGNARGSKKIGARLWQSV